MVYNVDLKKARGPLSFGVIFTLVGLLFLAIMSGILISNINKKEHVGLIITLIIQQGRIKQYYYNNPNCIKADKNK